MSSKTKTTSTKEEAKPALVPKLRFPEFRGAEGWQPVTLEEASTPVTERVGERKLTPVSISAGIGFVPQAEKFGRDISGNQYQLYTLVRDGDFVFNKGNSLKFPQGCVYQLKGWGEVAAPNVFICFRLKKGYSDGFFQQCFEQNQHGRELQRHITSGARSNGLLNISKETFFGVEIATPSPAEQQKIAECLSSVDELMATQARKVDALKTHKKGLMQQLFPRVGETVPKLRFPEFRGAEWVQKKLEDVAPLQRGFDLPSDLIRPGKIPIVYSNGIQKYHEVGMATAPGLVTGRSGTIGKLHFIEHGEYWPHNTSLWVTDFKGHVPRFVYYLYDSIGMGQFSSGSGVPTLNRNDVHAFSSAVPKSPAEQQKIAECLSSVDELMAAETQKHAALQRHKRGLMQQLFPALDEVSAP